MGVRAGKFAAVVLAAFGAAWACAQLPSVTEAPAPLPSLEWKQLQDEGEGPREFTAAFPSAFTSGYPENDIVPVQLHMPRDATGPLPAVVILHYWGATDLRVERAMANELAGRGVASVIVTLPYHLARAPKGTRSGAMAIQPDPAALRAMMIQSVLDVRRAIQAVCLRPDIDSTRLAITGTSLGSIVSALVYAVEPRLSAAAFILGGVDLAHVIWHSSKAAKEKEAMRAKGITEASLREELKTIEPSNFLNRTESHALVVAAKFDSVVPPIDTLKLAELLPGSKRLTLETGHYGGVFVQRSILHVVSQFLESELKGTPYKVPDRILAPTVRIAAALSTERPLQVGIGIDLLATKRRDLFSTLLITPRGPQLYVGAALSQGISVGVFGSLHRVAPGVMWSFVL